MWTNLNNRIVVSQVCILQWTAEEILCNPPPHLKSVAVLPCEIWMFSCTTLDDSYSIQRRFLVLSVAISSEPLEKGQNYYTLIYSLSLAFQRPKDRWHSMTLNGHFTLNCLRAGMCVEQLCYVARGWLLLHLWWMSANFIPKQIAAESRFFCDGTAFLYYLHLVQW